MALQQPGHELNLPNGLDEELADSAGGIADGQGYPRLFAVDGVVVDQDPATAAGTLEIATEADIVTGLDSPAIIIESSSPPQDSEKDASIQESKIRAATIDDLDALVAIELEAFNDVYGQRPGPNADPAEQARYQRLVEYVTEVYRERLDLLGPYGMIRVIESAEHGVHAMIVWLRTNLKPGDLTANGRALRDMTRNEEIKEAFDPDGENAYVVNLAARKVPGESIVSPGRLLMDESIARGNELGLKWAYFESRLPDFAGWNELQRRTYEAAGVPFDDSESARRARVEQYWRLTDNRTGMPLDRLMRYYVREGGIPIGVVANAWDRDHPSHGYGVLFGLQLKAAITAERAAQRQQNVTVFERQVEDAFLRDPSQLRLIGGHTLELIKRYGGWGLLGGVALGGALLAVNGQGSEVWRALQNDMANPWVAAWKGVFSAYLLSWSAIGLSIATSSAQKAAEKIPFVQNHLKDTKLWQHVDQLNYWARNTANIVNGASALLGGGLFIGAVTTAIPEGMGKDVLYLGGAADIASTIAGRILLTGIFRKVFGGRPKAQIVPGALNSNANRPLSTGQAVSSL